MMNDEIYTMKDGEIVAHQILSQSPQILPQQERSRKYLFPHLRLSFASLCSHKGRSFQLMIGILLSLLCIVVALTLTRHLEKQFHQYIYSMVPASGISFQSRYQQSLSLELLSQMKGQEGILKAEMFLDDYECLGIGFHEERYEQSQTLFIGDDTSPYTYLSLKYGRLPQSHNEIVLSLSTAQHLVDTQDVSSLIGKSIYAWYQHEWEVKSICYHIVGITTQTTTLDTFYQMDHAYIYLLKDVYHYQLDQISSHLGILYVHPDYQRQDIIKQLEKQYPDYRFMAIGESTSQNVSQTIEQVNMILFLFSCLAILSSLFLIGEIMFLNVIQKKKDLAVMKCFGAGTFDILRIVLYESIQIVICSQILCFLFYYQVIQIINSFIKQMFEIETLRVELDWPLMLFVFLISDILVLCSQIPPLLYILKMNTVEALKE